MRRREWIPGKIICPKHNRPATKFQFVNKNHIACARCFNEYKTSDVQKTRRAAQWDSGDIRCKKHPDRRCNRARYKANGHRMCGGCTNRNADGSIRQTLLRSWKRPEFIEQRLFMALRKRRNQKILENKI